MQENGCHTDSMQENFTAFTRKLSKVLAKPDKEIFLNLEHNLGIQGHWCINFTVYKNEDIENAETIQEEKKKLCSWIFNQLNIFKQL